MSKHVDLEQVFATDDQSALIHNLIASVDATPHAWCRHDLPQSVLGQVMYPKVVEVVRGDVYTLSRDGLPVEDMLAGHRWLPWLYEGEGKRLAVRRTVGKDLWLGEVRLKKPQAAMLVLECARDVRAPVTVHPASDGVVFRWHDISEVRIRFACGRGDVILSDDINPLKRRFAGQEVMFDNTVPVPGWLQSWHWHGRLWVGVVFRNRITVSISVVKPSRRVSRIPRFDTVCRGERSRWYTFFDRQVPPIETDDPVIRDTYYFAWQTIWSNRCEGGVGVLKKPYISPTRLHYAGEWWWDDAYHMAALRHGRWGRRVYDLMANFLPYQRKNGGFPGSLQCYQLECHPDRKPANGKPEDAQPPVIGFTLQVMKEKPGWPTGKKLSDLYDMLIRHAKYHYRPERDVNRNGLTHYHHGLHSGADQSPRWDSQKLRPERTTDYLKPTEPVCMNVWMSLLWQTLGEMAALLGKKKEAASHHRRSKQVFDLIEEKMWDARRGIYFDLDATDGRKIRVLTPFSFMPMLSPLADPGRVSRMVESHLLNPKEFWCRYPLPSVALNEPTFDPHDMWRGPTWVNLNWLVISGLKRQGYDELARELAYRTVEMVGPRYRRGRRIRSPRIWEWYHPLTGEAKGNCQYSWSALVIDLILMYLV